MRALGEDLYDHLGEEYERALKVERPEDVHRLSTSRLLVGQLLPNHERDEIYVENDHCLEPGVGAVDEQSGVNQVGRACKRCVVSESGGVQSTGAGLATAK